CLKMMIPHYASFKVGGVSGEKKILQQDRDGVVAQGEGLYWHYESFLNKLDYDLYTTAGAAGELFSIRSGLYTALPENTIIDDFVQSLTLCIKGYVVRYEPKAFSLEYASLSLNDEKERKTRIAAGAFQAMGILTPLLNVLR